MIFLEGNYRASKPSRRILESTCSSTKRLFGLLVSAYLVINPIIAHPKQSFLCAVNHTQRSSILLDNTINNISQFALSTASNDVFTLSQMLKQEDVASFVEAMLKEVDDHESRDHWDLIERSDMPAISKKILSIWSFKRKRLPDGSITKHKAHAPSKTWRTFMSTVRHDGAVGARAP